MSQDRISARRYTEGEDRVEALDVDAAEGRVEDRSLLWVDVRSDDVADLERLDRQLGLEGVLSGLTGARAPSIRFLAGSIQLSVRGVGAHREGQAPSTLTLHLVAARNVVVSVHDGPMRGIEEPICVVAGDPRFGRLDAGRFMGLLLDGVLHGYHLELEEVEREIDELDERALRREAHEDILDTLVRLRRRVSLLRRALAPGREVYAALTRPIADEPSPIGSADPALSARFERTIDALEHAREQLLGSFDIMMARTGQRTNDIVRTLTVISSVLLPSVVIAGVMGMNFHPVLFDDPGLFFVVLLLMATLAIVTLLAARLRRWI